MCLCVDLGGSVLEKEGGKRGWGGGDNYGINRGGGGRSMFSAGYGVWYWIGEGEGSGLVGSFRGNGFRMIFSSRMCAIRVLVEGK